jgi:hypothetical protein
MPSGRIVRMRVFDMPDLAIYPCGLRRLFSPLSEEVLGEFASPQRTDINRRDFRGRSVPGTDSAP